MHLYIGIESTGVTADRLLEVLGSDGRLDDDSLAVDDARPIRSHNDPGSRSRIVLVELPGDLLNDRSAVFSAVELVLRKSDRRTHLRTRTLLVRIL